VIAIRRRRLHALAVKPGKQRGRTCPIETLVVIKDANLQYSSLPANEKYSGERMIRIAG
jgi:hypothetical protein